jgi:hypothetical protein
LKRIFCHLCSKKLEENVLLLLDHCLAHRSADALKPKDGKTEAMFLSKNANVLIQPMDQGITEACKVCYCSQLPGGVVNSGLQVTEFLKTLMLKDVAHSAELAWGKLH